MQDLRIHRLKIALTTLVSLAIWTLLMWRYIGLPLQQLVGLRARPSLRDTG